MTPLPTSAALSAVREKIDWLRFALERCLRRAVRCRYFLIPKFPYSAPHYQQPCSVIH
ncbi:MAG: hypothetical protein V7K71_15690 [Nostoc sp.]|uniref:hypothetical protein n=1 Tax=Nostoc sp. TaxID=1180 RepID=UPI002FF4F36E